MAKRKEEDRIKVDREKLKSKVLDIQQSRNVMVQFTSNPAVSGILAKWTREIEGKKEQLIYVDKKDVEKSQAEILARRELLGNLSNAYLTELQDAKKELEEFERQNQLFLHAADEDGVIEEQA